jgi:hypothetical protein
MVELESIPIKHGAKPRFWRRLKKVASNMGNEEKKEEYEQAFHLALAKKV